MECLILIKQKTLASMCSTKHSWSVKEIQNIKLSQKICECCNCQWSCETLLKKTHQVIKEQIMTVGCSWKHQHQNF